MTYKSLRIKELTQDCADSDLDPRFLGFFRCFNEGRYFEAHEVLEDLWLEDRQSPDYGFYKGLIQLAGAFVHLEKGRLPPAGALFRLAISNLEAYLPSHHRLNTAWVAGTMREWLSRLEKTNFQENPLRSERPPRLSVNPA